VNSAGAVPHCENKDENENASQLKNFALNLNMAVQWPVVVSIESVASVQSAPEERFRKFPNAAVVALFFPMHRIALRNSTRAAVLAVASKVRF
jgi:hypothetical protein